MATFVLVHGAWHGGWCWSRVAAQLRAQGHEVFTPTLTGLGERVHLAGPEIDLDTHIQDVTGLLEAEELSDVVLCGHSYGGFVITGVAEKAVERIGALVYLDAFLPEDGQSLSSITGTGQVAPGEDWRIPPRKAEAFRVATPEDRDWVDRRCVPQPRGTFNPPLAHSSPWKRIANLTYVRAEGYDPSPFVPYAQAAKDDPAWHYEGVPCGHDVMVDMPMDLAEILAGAAARSV